MRNKREHIRHAAVLILAAAGLITCTAPFSASSGLAHAQAAAPSWSYTGSLNTATLRANGKIAFTSDRDGNQEIYMMNPDGTNQTRLTNNSIVDDHAMWSPDGKKLAFVSQREAGGFAIFQMNMDGTNRVEITSLSNFVNVTPWGVVGFSMSWSPDGRKIAFQDPYYNDIWVVDVETHARQNLTNDGGGQIRFFDYHPAWSPDGSMILFSSPRDVDPCTTLYTINPDGTNRRLLSRDHCPAYSPSWSPDGMKIVFVQLNGEFVESELRIANSDGTNVRIFDGGYPDLNNRDYPRWSPDGLKIAFNMTNSQDIEIYVKNIDGTGYAQLTNTPAGLNYRPSWQPLLPTACPNPIDCNEFFVRQHYQDFLNREPDAAGLAYWTENISKCSDPARRPAAQTEAECTGKQQVTTSAAFFLSPEFQYTGYYVYRLYKGSLLNNGAGRFPTYQEFLRDVRQVANGIIQNNQLSAAAIEANRKTFAEEFTRRAEFRSLYDPLSNFDYVERLFQTTGISVSAAEKQTLVEGLNNQTETRASVLQKVVDGAVVITEGNQQFTTAYGRAFYDKEFNAAFVLMEYFGYLRRDPDPAGYQNWLDKLNTYGNYIDAEMVKSFIISPEYRARFGQP